ncbi:MAG: DUF389 domain-containing protein [Pegethrix bostrychoides GSE-TBD4-15B]|jgi:uncharacterized hydrophobic protein (TIGR00271 family)|uniref:DUF389 domain-containing protein n=1 Tax=Pegethrix bostrychoides GSE-TBD4-15B TaxID=2839662 RepID=A0A951U6Q7_9CYAN|nr:DUF389 domain-containing protein [Pegethrix bostrychoides GSE-TBD4-15B]
MRQLFVQVPKGQGKTVLEVAQSCDGTNLAQMPAQGTEQPLDLVLIHISNGQVERLLDKLQDLPELSVTLLPTGVMALHPPSDAAPEQVTNVEERSPIEIFLSGLQSTGSWKGFLSYAAIAGIIVWIGLYTNTSYLLVAAMLLAPFAGPAMNTALATARGDRKLLGSSIFRYFSALSVTIATTALLSWVLQQQNPTSLMIDGSQISSVSALIPLAAGAAGALSLVQSERSSLVSGAATGMLVSASLAPPAGLVGMGAAIGRWDLATNGIFLLLLQLGGINLAAALVFRLFGGLSVVGARYQRGQRGVFPVATALSVVLLAGLLVWQFSSPPNLLRSSRAQRANAEVQQVVQQSNLADLVESNVRFTRANIPGQNSLLSVVYVQRKANLAESSEQIRAELTQAIQERLVQQGNITPLVDVNVLEAPE